MLFTLVLTRITICGTHTHLFVGDKQEALQIFCGAELEPLSLSHIYRAHLVDLTLEQLVYIISMFRVHIDLDILLDSLSNTCLLYLCTHVKEHAPHVQAKARQQD